MQLDWKVRSNIQHLCANGTHHGSLNAVDYKKKNSKQYYKSLQVIMRKVHQMRNYKKHVTDIVTVKYINKRLTMIQNTRWYIIFQHFLSYELRESTETIHRRVLRLAHRSIIHMLFFFSFFFFSFKHTCITSALIRRSSSWARLGKTFGFVL